MRYQHKKWGPPSKECLVKLHQKSLIYGSLRFQELLFPRIILCFDEIWCGFVWYYMYRDGMNVPNSFDVVDFSRDLCAVTCDKAGENNEDMLSAIRQFVDANAHFVQDTPSTQLSNVITPPAPREAIGYSQMDYLFQTMHGTRYPEIISYEYEL